MPFGSRLSSTINVAGSSGSFTGRNCDPGMLTVVGYVSSTWMPSMTVELNVVGVGTRIIATSTVAASGHVIVETSVVVVDVVVDVVVVVLDVLDVVVLTIVVVVVATAQTKIAASTSWS